MGNKEEFKMDLKLFDFDEVTPEKMADLIDSMMNQGISRLKISESDDVQAGKAVKEYHHGRCDVNSPWACGQAFDVLEDDENKK